MKIWLLIIVNYYDIFIRQNKLIAAQLFKACLLYTSMVNTLFFVFAGEFMAFLIVYLNYHQSFSVIVNDQLFLQEVSQLLIGNLGCILIIPVTIFLQSYIYTCNKELPFFKTKE